VTRMFGAVAAFEFRHQVRQPIFWIGTAVFGLLTFGLVAADNVSIGTGGAVRENSPFGVIIAHSLFSLFFMFVLTAFVANVVVRDDDTGFGPIVRSTHVSKATYLYGRFVGAFAAAALSFLVVPLMFSVGALMPWLDPETVGPFRPQDYLFAYGLIALPNLFMVGAVLFALATVTRSMMATYLGLVGFLVAYFVLLAVADRPELEDLVALLEPFAQGAVAQITEYWTAAERNSRLPPLESVLLANRALVLGLGAAALAGAYALFRFDTVGVQGQRARRRATPAAAEAPAPTTLAVAAHRRFDSAAGWTQFLARTRLELTQTFRSPAFGVLIALFLLLSVPQLWFATAGAYDARIFPVTRMMIETLRGTFALGPLIIAIYYAGELVWRERDRRFQEIVGSAPVSDWAFLIPKVLAITLVLLAALIAAAVAACGVQLARGYTALEPEKYLAWWVLPGLVDMFLISALAVFLQSVSHHKFVGWLLMIVYVVATISLTGLGVEHNMVLYGSGPVPELSDMNGLGRAGEAQAWFQAYWSAAALILLVLAYGLWSRSGQASVRDRLRRLPRRLKGAPAVVLVVAVAAFAGLGAWIYTNTVVWNDFRTRTETERWAADYEKQLLRYERLPQPKIVDVRLNVDLRPEEGSVRTQGEYLLENRTAAPIKALHVRFERDLEVRGLSVEGARPKHTYDRFNYRVFAFDTPMAPGERRRMTFATRRTQQGFTNDGESVSGVLENGAFLNNNAIAPLVGMGRDFLLDDRSVRRKYGLPRELRPPKLEDASARAFNGLRRDSDWVTSDITVITDADQTPMAPGYRVSETVADGRRTARFRSEAPINHFFSIQSARFALKTARAGEVALGVYHHPGHAMAVDRMNSAMQAALQVCEQAFSPYQFRQARILEFPATVGSFAQSFANTIPYSENLGFIVDYRLADEDRSRIDLTTYVTAHEIAHQWWGHQLVPSDQQGAALPTETLAQYSALLTMERLYGPDQIRKFLKLELDRYLRARGGQGLEELPLIRVENQPHIYYQKGSLAMWRLKEVVGEAAVNRALRRLLATYAFKPAPYPRSAEMIALIREEAGPEHQAIITDLFERITLYDVKTERVTSRQRPDGRHDVELTVTARKLYADGQGVEREAPLSEPVQVGVFSAKPGDKAFTAKDVLALETRPLRSGRQTLRFTVDRAPRWAGADPYNALIDRNSDDNLAEADG
jgi:ABC-2 type transport system permease protein